MNGHDHGAEPVQRGLYGGGVARDRAIDDVAHDATGRKWDGSGISVPSLSIVAEKKTLAELLTHGSVLAGDRRKTRYERLRIAHGRSKAVNPQLGEAIEARLSRRRKG